MVHKVVLVPAFLLIAAVCGCASPPAQSSQDSATLILASSSPAAGSTVTGPVPSLRLTFNPPARLREVNVNGPGGAMPMMIEAAGEVADYDLPLPDLRPGSYSVEWRASVGERDYSGTFGFTLSK